MLNFFSSLSIKARLSIGFGLVLALLVLLTVQGINRVNYIDRTLAEITDLNSVKQRYAINFRGSVHDRAIAIRDIAIADSTARISQYEKEIRSLESFYAESESQMAQMLRQGVAFTAKERDVLKRIEDIQTKTLPIVETIINMKKAGQQVDQKVLNEARPAFIEWLNTINQFIDYQEEQNQIATPQARNVAGTFQNFMLILCAIAIGFSVAVGFLIERSLRVTLGGELNEAQEVIAVLAEGDLTKSLKTPYSNSILDSLDTMSTKLTSIAKNIIHASDKLQDKVEEVSDGSTVVLNGAQQQAQLTIETISQLGNMSSSIDRVADIAAQTEINSEKTANNAMEGRKIVNSAAQEMEQIATTVNQTVNQIKLLDENTKQIGGIASVISGISEQTNLLALNAAIEAARAGESGRGFAVVADEVRQLAKRTGEATSQIESMVNDVQSQTAASVVAMETTQPQVENGKKQIMQATELLKHIEMQATDSLELVKQVSSAATDQVQVVTDFSTAMEQVAAMSENTIDSMNKNDKATKILSDLSTSLKKEVGFFKV
ncbi:methyl-accepting chemotaxis protein [Pseudoalteromonas atlantica]|uniref:methyl-accepting chemotaxis protein n=1 Tax=Pseudoalteromonas atlantica TaxID=288 RepID=UPI0037370AA3